MDDSLYGVCMNGDRSLVIDLKDDIPLRVAGLG